MIHRFKVKYNAFGVTTSEVLPLNFKAKAQDLKKIFARDLNIEPAQIIQINREFGGRRGVIKEEDMFVVLADLYSASSNGENLVDSLKNILNALYEDKDTNNQMFIFSKQNLSISQTLERLKVDSVIVALISSGVSTGKLTQSLDKATEYVETMDNIKAQSKVGFSGSILKIIFGILFTFVVPIFLADFFNGFIKDFDKEPSFVINLFNFIKDNNLYFLIIAAAIFAVLFYLFKFQKQQTSNWPLFSTIFIVAGLKKALAFIPFYSTLSSAGVNDKDIVVKYKKIDSEVADNLFKNMNKGLSIIDAIKASNIDKNTTKYLASALAVENLEAQKKSFAGVEKVLIRRLQRESKKLNKTLSSAGWIMISIGLIMLIGGYSTMGTIAL